MPEVQYYEYLKQVWNECQASTDNKELQRMLFDKAASPYYYWLQNQAISAPPSKSSVERVTARFTDGPGLKLKDNPEARKALKDNGFRWNTPEGRFDWSRDIDILQLNHLMLAWPFKDLTLTEPKKQG